MTFSLKKSLKTSLKSSLIILKLVIPIYILADVLIYYNLLEYITFIFEPITSFLDLPSEASLALVSGIFLNLYAAIAFAAPLGLSPKEWTILAVFLGVCHSIIVETAIMKKMGISNRYSFILRFAVGLLLGYITTLLPDSWFASELVQNIESPVVKTYSSIFELLSNSFYESVFLSLKIILLITIIIFALDYVKSLKRVQEYSNKVNSAFSITVGVILGITYGAGLLISEYEKGTLSKKEILFIGTFLMICHAIIEDTLLFVIFGSNPWITVGLRLIFAFVFSVLMVRIFHRKMTNL